MRYQMTPVDELRALKFTVMFNPESSIWVATRNELFDDPLVFTSRDLVKLVNAVKRYLNVYCTYNDQKR